MATFVPFPHGNFDGQGRAIAPSGGGSGGNLAASGGNAFDSLSPATSSRLIKAIRRVNRLLSKFSQRNDYQAILQSAFGAAGTDGPTFASRVDALAPILRGPGLGLTIEVRSSQDLAGAQAAYTVADGKGQPRVYINADWLARTASTLSVERVLLEEAGHAIDHWLNADLDSPGDEGQLFSALLLGPVRSAEQLAAIAREDDRRLLLIDGQPVAAELSSAPLLSDAFVGSRTTAEDTPLVISGFSIADGDNGVPGPITLSLRITTVGGTSTITAFSGGVTLSGGTNGSGDLTLQGTLAGLNATIAGFLFTPDSNANGVNTPVAPSITLTAIDLTNGDGPISLGTGPIQVTPINDPPGLSPTPLSVAEGGTAGFATTNFNLVDVDNLPQQVIYKLVSLPGQGVLNLNGKALVVGSTFASTDVGGLTYIHSGAQVLPGVLPGSDADAFTISVDDGAGGTSASVSIPIALTPLNQAPSVSGTIPVFEGQRGVPVTLNISDGDQAPGVAHTVTITSLPVRGTLRYNGLAISAPFTLPSLSGLTYDHDGNDLNGGYPPNESFGVTVSDDGGGQGPGGSLSTNATITLAVQRVNDDPTLVSNTPVITASGSTVITNAALQVSDPDSAAANLTYTLTTAVDPLKGQLQLFTGGVWVGLQPGASITQEDIDNNRLRYNFLDGTLSGTSDSFTFTVKDGAITLLPNGYIQTRDGGIYTNSAPAPLPGDPLTPISLSITYQNPVGSSSGGGTVPGIQPNNTPPSLGTNNLIRTSEGATVTITGADLAILDSDSAPAERVYRLTAPPAGGTLQLNGVSLGALATFTQDDIDNGRLTFVHGGGEVFDTGFSFNISDGKSVVTAGGADFRFGIKVTPINDAPSASAGSPFLVEGGTFTFNSSTPGPLLSPALRQNITISDADGSGDQVFVGGSNNPNPGADPLWDPGSFSLPDTASQRYLLIDQLPADGVLEFDLSGSGAWTVIGDGSGGTLDRATLRITQAQLDAGRLRYQHNGKDGPGELSDSFQIIPFDRFDTPGAAVTVPLTIAGLNDPPVATENAPLTVVEGGSGVIKGSNGTTGNLPRLVFTDSDNTSLQRQYRITSLTTNGQLFLNGSSLGVNSVFTQADLDADQITYRHDGSETSTDSFSFTVSDGGGDNPITGATNNVPGTFQIFVTPANDPPTLTAPATLDVFAAGGTAVPVSTAGTPVVSDSDLLALRSGETDVLRLEVQLLDAADVLIAAGAISYTAPDPSSPLTFLAGKGSNSLVLQGSRSEINAVLASLTVAFSTDLDASNLKLRVTVDDRLYTSGGVLSSGANGGPVNQNNASGNPVPINATNNRISRDIAITASNSNDAPTLNHGAGFAVNEDASVTLSGFTLADADSFNRDVSVTVQLFCDPARTIPANAASEGRLLLGATAGLSTSSGNGTNTITLTGPLSAVQTALNLLQFQGATDFNGGGSGAGNTYLRTTFRDFGHANVPAGNVVSVDDTITIRPVNDAPVLGVPGNGVIASGTSYDVVSGFSLQDTRDTSQGAADSISVTVAATDGGAAYGAISILSPGGAVVSNNNTATVTVTGTSAQVQAALNSLRYTPTDPNVDRTVTITATADDGANGAEGVGVGGNTTATGSFTINVSATNDPPQLTVPASRTVSEDSTANGFSGANLISFSDADDFGAIERLTLSVAHGSVNLVTRTGLTLTGGNYGTSTLTVTGTKAALNAALASLTYTPAGNYHGSDGLTVTVNDLGSTGSGGTQQDSRTIPLTVTPLNDQPTAASDVVLPAISEDLAATATGTPLSSLAFGYSDATDNQTANGGGNTATPFSYLAVVGSTNYTAAQGVWQISTTASPDPANPADWISILTTGLTTSAALIFRSDSQVRFVPAANFHGTPGSLSVRLADSSAVLTASASSANTFDLAAAGGTSTTGAWSAVDRFISTGVTNVNDRPTATPTSLAATTEDNPNPPGATLTALGFGYSDATDNQSAITGGTNAATPFGGIAITGNAATAAEGVWQYNLNGGGGWVSIGSPSDTSALLLPASASLRFLPNSPDYSGTPGSLTVRVADTPLSFAAAADLTGQLGATGRYSNLTTLGTSVTPVNDVPAFSKGPDQTLLEDAGAQSVSGWATGLSRGPADEAGQTLSFLTSNDNNALFSVQPSIDASGNLIYTPAPNAGGSATVTVRIRDNGGTANGGVDTSPPQTFLITVVPVNDPPAGSDKALTTLEDTPLAITATDFGFSDPSDSPANALQSVVITTLPAAGSLFLGATPVLAGQEIPAAQLGSLSFVPAANASGCPYASFSFQVRDNGGTANGGVDLDPTPNTITFNVTPVNDPPVAGDDVLGSISGSRPAAGTVATFKVTDNDSDVDSPLDPASLTLTGTPGPGQSLVVAGEGTWSVNLATGEISFTPLSTFFGDPTPITYTIADQLGAISNAATVSIDYDNLPITRPSIPPSPSPRPIDFYLLLDNSTSMKGTDPSGVARIEAQNRLAFETLKSSLALAGYGYSLKGSSTFQPFLESTNLTSSQTLATEILNYELVDDPSDGSSTNARDITIHVVDFGYLVTHTAITFSGSNPSFGEILARDVLLTQTPDLTYGTTTSPDWIARGLPAPSSLDAYTAPGTSGNRYSGTEMLGALIALDTLLQKELSGVTTDTITSVAMITDGRPERRPWWDNRPDFGQGWTGTNVALPTSSWLDGDPILSSGLRYTSNGTPIRVPTAAGVDIWGQAQTSLNNTLDTVAARAGASNVNVLAIGMGDGGISNWNAIYTDLFTNQTFDASRSWNYQFSTSGQLPPLSG